MSKSKKKALSILMMLVLLMTAACLQADESYAAKAKVKAKVSISGANYPAATIVQGKSFTIKGKLSSAKKIKRVEVGIVTASSNKWTKYKYDNKKVNAKSFNLSKAAGKLKFNKLAAGKYKYRIYAHTTDGVAIVVNRAFTVSKPAAKATTKTTANNATASKPASATRTIIAAVADKDNTPDGDRVVLTGAVIPSVFSVGKGCSVKGKISSRNEIKRVEIGIIIKATNRWSEYKYEDSSVNAKTFDISKAASTLKFDQLPGGTFSYRIYVHTENGVTTLMNETFTVTPSSKPAGAIKWATMIANDDRFTYGKGYGSYFNCCVCDKKTTKPEDARFTCMPFLAAAYAHGTGDANLMNNGKHVMNLNDKNFQGSLGKAWFKMGLCKHLTISDLQPGDVIIKWSATNDSGHAWMYGGGDKIIEAVPSGIRVLNSGASAKLKRYGRSEGTPSKNYVMRYRH